MGAGRGNRGMQRGRERKGVNLEQEGRLRREKEREGGF